MQVRMAEHYGMCFGVRDAVDMALELAHDGPLTILGDLVHNPDVVAQMDAAGAVRAERGAEVGTTAVLLTAHGTADRVKLELRQQGLQVHDATCPLVTRAHLALRKLVAEGRHPIVIGQAKHVEVRGLVGDLDDYTILLDESDLDQLDVRMTEEPHARLGVVAQTTQPLERVMELTEALRARFPDADVRLIDTVCQPTKDRQRAMRLLVEESNVVVVVGGPQSNNSRKLAELARDMGRSAHLIANASELRAEWFIDCETVGLTAGTSTPDPVIQEVRRWLEELPATRLGPISRACAIL